MPTRSASAWKRRVAIAGFVACLLAGSAFLARFPGDRLGRDRGRIAEVPFAESLKSRLRDHKIVPTSLPFHHSEWIADFSMDRPGSRTLSDVEKIEMRASPDAPRKTAWRVRFGFKGQARLRIEPLSGVVPIRAEIAVFGPSGQYLFSEAVSSLGSYRTGVFPVSSGVHQLQFEFRAPFLGKIFIESSGRLGGGDKPNVPRTLVLRLSPENRLILDRLAETARTLSARGVFVFPKERVNAALDCAIGAPLPARVKIGLAGRTLPHFSFPPSMDVQVISGPLCFGMRSFKLSRWEARTYLLDLIYASVLQDEGLMSARQELVGLELDGQSQGYYVMQEDPGPEFFDALRRTEGDIMGFELGLLFRGYPYYSKLRETLSYRRRHGGRLDPASLIPMTSRVFAESLDTLDMAKLTAFCSLFPASHAFGLDDLHFYQDPLMGRFKPILRDSKPTFPPPYYREIREIAGLRGTLGLWLFGRPFSSDPKSILSPSMGSAALSDPPVEVCLWDVHPAIQQWLNIPSALDSFREWLSRYAGDKSLEEKIRRRYEMFAQTWSKAGKPIPKDVRDQRGSLGETKAASLSGLVREIVDKPFLGFRKTSRGIALYNLNPFPAPLGLERLGPARLLTLPMEPGAAGSVRHYALAMDLEFKLDGLLGGAGSIRRDSPVMEMSLSDAARSQQVLNRLKKEHRLLELPTAVEANLHRGRSALLRSKSLPGPVAEFLFEESLPGDRELIVYWFRNAASDSVAAETRLEFDDGISYAPARTAFLRLDGRAGSVPPTQADLVARRLVPGEGIAFAVFTAGRAPQARYYALRTPAHVFDSRRNILPAREPVADKGHENLSLVEFFKEDGAGVLRPRSTSLRIPSGVLEVPRGKTLRLPAGTRMLFGPNACLRVLGRLEADGKPGSEVALLPAQVGGAWRGLDIIGSEGPNTLRHVLIEAAGSEENNRCGPAERFGGVNVIDSAIDLEDVRIRNSLAGDGMNGRHCRLSMRRSVVEGCRVDGVDLDFCSANVADSRFLHNGGDGLDISGTLVASRGNRFEGNKDKGFSVGEASRAVSDQDAFVRCGFGVAVKDSSWASIRGGFFEGNAVGLATFISRPQYGSSEVHTQDCRFMDSRQFLVTMGYNPSSGLPLSR